MHNARKTASAHREAAVPGLLYRLTHRRYSRRATLRSLHVLGTALEMGCPLDQSLAVTAELSETWGLRDVRRAVTVRMAHGESLSHLMGRLQPPFTPALVAMAELGEAYGNMPAALLAASGSERLNAFSPQIQARARTLSSACIEVWDKGLVSRSAEGMVLQALRQGADGLGFFVGLPSPMEGPRSHVEGVSLGFLDRTHIGSLAAAIEPGNSVPFPADQGSAPATGSEQRETVFDPGSMPAGQTRVGFRKNGDWLPAVELPSYVFPDLMRHLLFLARIPYGSTESCSGWIRMEAGDRWHRLSARFAPSAKQLALTLYFDPAVTAA